MNSMEEIIQRELSVSVSVKQHLLTNCVPSLVAASERIVEEFRAGRLLLLAGNGGSSTDAMHIAAEFVGHFRRERDPLPAISLASNTAAVTAIGNDYGYQMVFARQVRAFAKVAGVFVGLSTSGNSPSIVLAAQAARELGIFTVGLTGASGGALKDHVDVAVCVPSTDTARIQESHIAIGHAWSELVERILYPE